MSCTYQMDHGRLFKLVMGGVHLHLFFWRRLSAMNWRRTSKERIGGVYLI